MWCLRFLPARRSVRTGICGSAAGRATQGTLGARPGDEPIERWQARRRMGSRGRRNRARPSWRGPPVRNPSSPAAGWESRASSPSPGLTGRSIFPSGLGNLIHFLSVDLPMFKESGAICARLHFSPEENSLAHTSFQSDQRRIRGHCHRICIDCRIDRGRGDRRFHARRQPSEHHLQLRRQPIVGLPTSPSTA